MLSGATLGHFSWPFHLSEIACQWIEAAGWLMKGQFHPPGEMTKEQ